MFSIVIGFMYLHNIWFYLGKKTWLSCHSQDLTSKPNYLVTFTVGHEQKHNIDAAVKKVIS
jgi:hypothetical protein